MAQQFSDRCQRLRTLQSGIIARWQAADVGLHPNTITALLRNGRWQRLGWGVYATYAGEPSRLSVLWAAVLEAGPRAILSHESAAELDGLICGPNALVHVTVPRQNHIAPIHGVVIHRSARIEQARHPSLAPPRTMIEETVLDLSQAADGLDAAVSWLRTACQHDFTTPARLRMRLEMRKKLRWRHELTKALEDLANPARSA